jgi:uncharacterized protein (TIGR00251 family)
MYGMLALSVRPLKSIDEVNQIRYNVVVRFNSDIIEVEGDTITVGIRSRPERGKANRELIERLAKYFDISRSNVRIAAGTTSRKKIVEIVK